MIPRTLRAAIFAGLASAAFAVALSGQSKPGGSVTKKPSRSAVVQIGDHRLGESFIEWLAVEKIDLDRACQDRKQTFTAEPSPPEPPQFTYPEGWTQADFDKSIVAQAAWATDKRDKEQEAMLKNMSESLRHSQAEALCDNLRPIRDTGSGYWHDRRGLPADTEAGTRWTFANGKLAEEQDVYSTEITTKELGFLKEAYGPPALITKTPQQNAFGARWTDLLVTWHLPGGATLYMKASGGPSDDLIVTFISKEYANAPVEHEPNPYLPKQPH